jgi:hypothetical protein
MRILMLAFTDPRAIIETPFRPVPLRMTVPAKELAHNAETTIPETSKAALVYCKYKIKCKHTFCTRNFRLYHPYDA